MYDLKIHAGNPQNILWLILQQNAPGYCAFRWIGMNALMDFNSKHKHEATPGRWKSASKIFQVIPTCCSWYIYIYSHTWSYMNRWIGLPWFSINLGFEGLRLAPMASYCRSDQVMVWCLGSLVWNHRICLQGESLWGIPRIVVIGWLELWSPATPNTPWEGASKPDHARPNTVWVFVFGHDDLQWLQFCCPLDQEGTFRFIRFISIGALVDTMVSDKDSLKPVQWLLKTRLPRIDLSGAGLGAHGYKVGAARAIWSVSRWSRTKGLLSYSNVMLLPE